MTLKTFIRDGRGSGHTAQVTHSNELVVTGAGETETKFFSMASANTAYNFFIAKPGFSFEITAILFSAPTGATILDIYESSSPTSTTIDKQLVRFDTAAKAFYPISFSLGGFIRVTENTYLNAKTDNATVPMTIVGFYKGTHKLEGT